MKYFSSIECAYKVPIRYKPSIKNGCFYDIGSISLDPKDMNKERNFILDLETFIFPRTTINEHHGESTSNYSHKISKVQVLTHKLIKNSKLFENFTSN